MPVLKDLTGLQFNRLTVIRYEESRRQKRYWECLCECGRRVIVGTGDLRTGNTKSCGCLSSLMTTERNLTHGLSRIPEYRAYHRILTRCYDKNNPAYPDWGGRGIVMSYEWYISFENFYRDMGPRPSPKHSIERIDNDGPYTKQNCKWATMIEQQRNTRRNHPVTFNGKTMCITEWAEELGIRPGALNARINRLHWPLELALVPVKYKPRAFQPPRP